nr:M14 family metallopeptidase [uncultured Sphaerochaeta sp.]
MKSAYVFILLTFLTINVFPQLKTSDEWLTQFEKTDYLETSDYKATMDYFNQLADVSPYAKLEKFGTSPQGRDMMVIILSREKCFTPEAAKKSGKTITLVENGIHAGEIEGKDASMILLREILVTKEKEYLLDNNILLVIPIFSVDSHERTSPYNRINQNGPVNMGWRTTSTNYNLNRDFMKADAPEMKAWLKLYNNWLPDFFIDCHTTDGLDMQYTITYTVEKFGNIPSETGEWATGKYIPFIQKQVEDQGFLMAPYIWFVDRDMNKGLLDYVTPPKLSIGYTALQNRPGLLIETHSLKPYKERVYATKAIIESSLEYFNDNTEVLTLLNNKADEWTVQRYSKKDNLFPLSFKSSSMKDSILFKGLKWNENENWIAGTTVKEYTSEPFEKFIPHIHESDVDITVSVPYAYLVPAEWKEVIDVMKLHGIEYELLKEEIKLTVTRYKFKDVKFPGEPFEGRFLPDFHYDIYEDVETIPAGTFIVKTKQRRLPIVMHLFEPKGEDSFLKWGFFNTIFTETEYFEMYSMLPVAEKMVKENPELKDEFYKWLADNPQFKNDARERMRFFYKRSPYFDNTFNLYPVRRVEEKF